MPLSGHDITRVITEIAEPFKDGRIQKVYQPADRAVTLEVRARQETLLLHISVHPQMARIHVLLQTYPNPLIPPPFCQWLRRNVVGAKILDLEQLAGDRIVFLRYQKSHDHGALVAELTGRSANLYLVDEHNTVQGSLHRGRLNTGDRYHPPSDSLSSDRPLSERDDETLLVGSAPKRFPISEFLETQYRKHEDVAMLRNAHAHQVNTLTRRIKHTARRLSALESDLTRMNAYKEYEQYGELLKVSLDSIPPGAHEAIVTDYYDPELPRIVIPLDPSQSVKTNMEQYFRKYKKYCSAQRLITPRLKTLNAELEALRQQRDRLVEQGPLRETTTPPPFPSSAKAPGTHQRKRSEPLYRRFVSYDGLTIGVGRNARENEFLTFRAAKGRDLWLHARGVAGAHVTIFMDRHGDVPPQTLYDAAVLALLYSDHKRAGHGDISYTYRKYVKKVKGKPPGTVTYSQEKNLYVELDQARLQRLLGGHPSPHFSFCRRT